MRKLTEVIVRRPVAAVMIILAIVVFGISALFSLPQELTPEMEMPVLIIITRYQGAGPEEVEKLITRPVEGAAAALSGADTIISQSMENMSLVIIRYEYGIDMNNAYSDLKSRLDTIAARLPEDAGDPMIMELDINAMPVMSLSVTSDSKEDLFYYVENEIVPQLDRLIHVSQVSVSGGRDNYIRVELKEDMLRQYGLSMSSVISAVSSVDFTAPLGTAEFGDQNLTLRAQIKYETIEAMRNIPITLRTGDTIRLSDVADIYENIQSAQSLSRYNGQENIGISIQRRQSSSADRVSRDVMRVINQIVENDPSVNISVVYDTSEDIASSIMSIAQTMMLAVGLSMLVLFLFMGNIRASLIIGISMPVSLLVTFAFMWLMGFTLNMITMSGLVLGVGMMVDNAIVVIDSCFKSRTRERTFAESAVEGTGFVMLSVFAASMTTISVFLPLAFITGIAGQLFGQLGLSIVFALLASLFSAITLVPLFFVQFKPVERKDAPISKFIKRFEKSYGRLLARILPKKKTVFGILLAFLALSIYLATFLNMELMPGTDDGIISISVETRPGLKLENIDEIISKLEEMVANHPDTDRYSLSAGGGGGMMGFMMGGGGGGTASITAYLRDGRLMETNDVVEQWRRETRYMTDCDIDISASSGMGVMFGGGGAEIRLEADNFDNLREADRQVIALMEAHPDIIRVTSSLGRVSPQAEIVIDPLRAANLGMAPQMITGSIYSALNGSQAAEMRIGDQNYAIRVEYPEGRYETVGDVAGMMLMSPTGALIPLSEVATVAFSDTPQTIAREDGSYIATISGTTSEETRFTAQAQIDEQLLSVELPSGVYVGTNTQAQMMAEEFSSLFYAIATAIFLVFMIMAIQFESTRFSLMVMVCLPFTIIGSFTLLFLTGMTISMASLLGFLILVGTVVNNGILLVDTANRFRREQGMEVKEALVMASRMRLRPILMTSLTTMLAMMPLALGWGQGADMMQGLGVVVVGGLLMSTLLTLLFLPTFYLIIDGNPEKRARRLEHKMHRIEMREQKIHEIEQAAEALEALEEQENT